MTNMPKNQHFDGSISSQANDRAEDDRIDLSAVFSTIWRGKWVIFALAALSTLAGGYYAYVVAVPLYRATSVLMLETQQDTVVDLQSVVGGMSGDDAEVNSEVEVLKSRGLTGKVVDRLNLVEDPEFNSALRGVSGIRQAKETVKAALGWQDPPAPMATRVRNMIKERENSITALIDVLSVRNVPNTFVLHVTVETESAEKSALIADTIADLYILDQLEVKFEATEQATAWLTERVGELQVELEDAEQKLSRFSSSTELISVESLQSQEIQLKDLRERIATTEDAVVQSQALQAKLETATSRQDKSRLSEDPQLQRLLVRAESDDRIADAFDLRFQQVLQRAQLETTRRQQQVTALKKSEMELTQDLNRQSQDLITLQQLTRETEATRSLYEYFLARLKETAAQHGIQKADSRILSKAVIPNLSASPRKKVALAMSGMLGLMLGVGLVLLNEARKSGYRTARDLEAHTGYTVLGQIPQVPIRSRKRLLPYLTAKPSSAAAEAIRNLRTSVLLSNVDNPPQVIVSTSAVPGEGKTTNVLALAQNLVGLGKSVLLIEGDIRRRTLSQYFKSLPEKGLVSVLSGEASWQEAVHFTPQLGADLLVGQKSQVNAADLFASDKFKELVRLLRSKYDIILIDTPPVLVVPDARIIAQQADAVLFTVKWDKTSRQQVEESLRLFHNSNQTITGLVLSQISPKRMKAYGYGGKYGAYGGYSSKYYVN